MADAAGDLLRAWADQPAIDHHCHPLRRWPFQLSPVELRSAFTEALDPQLAAKHVVYMAGYQDAIRRIAAALRIQRVAALSRICSVSLCPCGKK